MRDACGLGFPDFDLEIFGSAPEMIAWLASHVRDVQVISLDCDLDATALIDPCCGSGEDVTAYLAQNIPHCAVLIHSSNAMRAPAMHMELAMAGCSRVVLCPFQDSKTWATDLRVVLDRG